MVENWLYYQYKNNPKSDFLIEEKDAFSFDRFYFLVADLAKALDYNGLKRNQIVLILLKDSISLLQSFFSCHQVGAIPVLVDPDKSSIELDVIMDCLSPDLVITSWNNRINSSRVVFYEEIMSVKSSCRSLEIIEAYNDDDVCCILCTSGSTGTAKLVRLTYANFYSSFKSWNNEMNFQLEDRYACCIPFHHIGGISIVMRSVIAGFSVSLCLPFKADAVLDRLEQSINYISLVPTMLEKILDKGEFNTANLKAIIVGGADIPNQLLKKIIDLNLPVFKTYGMTETSSGISGFFINKFLEKKYSSGRTFRDVKIKVKNDIFFIHGPMVMRGYYNQSLSNKTFQTNDVGYIDSEGFITVSGRRDRTILSGGEKISLIQVESALQLHPKIQEVNAFGVEDAKWGSRLIAAVKIIEEVSLNELRSWSKKHLSNHSVPKDFIYAEKSIQDSCTVLSKEVWQDIKSRIKFLK